MTIVLQEGSRPAQTVYVDRGRMRIDGERGDESVIIIDAADQRILFINEADRSYQEIDKKDLQAIKDFQKELRGLESAEFGRWINDLPPEQRKAGEALRVEMGMADDHSLPNLKFERTGEKRTVSGIDCEMYRGLRFGKVWEEDCISPWDAGIFPRDDLARLAKFFREWMRLPFTVETDVLSFLDIYPGFPVTRSLWKGSSIPSPAPTEVIMSVKHGPIPDTKFGVPPGFRKTALDSSHDHSPQPDVPTLGNP